MKPTLDAENTTLTGMRVLQGHTLKFLFLFFSKHKGWDRDICLHCAAGEQKWGMLVSVLPVTIKAIHRSYGRILTTMTHCCDVTGRSSLTSVFPLEMGLYCILKGYLCPLTGQSMLLQWPLFSLTCVTLSITPYFSKFSSLLVSMTVYSFSSCNSIISSLLSFLPPSLLDFF